MNDSRKDPVVFRAKMKRISRAIGRAHDALETARRELDDGIFHIIENEVTAGIGRMEADVSSARDCFDAGARLLVHAMGDHEDLLNEHKHKKDSP